MHDILLRILLTSALGFILSIVGLKVTSNYIIPGNIFAVIFLLSFTFGSIAAVLAIWI